MASSCYAIDAYYCGFIKSKKHPNSEIDVCINLTRYKNTKTPVPIIIHGDSGGFTMNSSSLRVFPARLISGYIALNNDDNTVAVRHVATDKLNAGYRLIAFESTLKQDSFISELDKVLDSNSVWLGSEKEDQIAPIIKIQKQKTKPVPFQVKDPYKQKVDQQKPVNCGKFTERKLSAAREISEVRYASVNVPQAVDSSAKLISKHQTKQNKAQIKTKSVACQTGGVELCIGHVQTENRRVCSKPPSSRRNIEKIRKEPKRHVSSDRGFTVCYLQDIQHPNVYRLTK